MASRARRLMGRLGDWGLTAAAVLGTVCIAATVAAVVLDISIVLFKTGSMEPTIPAGSMAVVRQVPVAAVEVGDVVTVSRPDALPITHRVVGIAGTGPVRELTMKGDANPVVDATTYEVSSVREVLFSVPGLARAIARLGHPLVLGSITLAATALVLWAFWPRRRPASRHAGAGPSSGPNDPGRSHSGGPSMLAVVLVGLVVAAPPAHAQQEQVVRGEVITLVSVLDHREAATLEPGRSATWQVGVSTDAPEPGTVTVSLRGDSDEPSGFRVRVRSCPTRWRDESCPQGVRDHGDVGLPAAWHELDDFQTDGQRWYAMEVSLADGRSPGHARLHLRASGHGDTVVTSGQLPRTGLGVSGLLAMALPMLAAGAALLVGHRRRRRGPGDAHGADGAGRAGAIGRDANG